MALPPLDLLLMRIRDGIATDADLAEAKALLAADARLPEEIRADALTEEPPIEAGGLLVLLGHDDGLGSLLRDAIASEEAPLDVDVTDDVLQAIGVAPEEPEETFALPVGPAIRAEAGDVDVSLGVLAALGLDAAPSLRDAVHAEAGTIDLSEAILSALALDPGPSVREALQSEAVSVDVARPVLETLGFETIPVAEAVAAEAGTVDVADAVMLAIGVGSLAPTMSLPEPANRPRFAAWGALVLLAAAILLAILVQGLDGAANQGTPEQPIALTVPEPVPANPVVDGVAAPGDDLRFASSSEVVVLDLQYGENVQVTQVDGDEGAVILWVEEEAWL